MVDFSTLLRKPAGQAPKPKALPPGDYTGAIAKFEVGDNNKNKTPYVRFFLNLTGWPDSVDEADRTQDGPSGSHPIELGKRQLRRDFFLTDDALWRLDELLRSCGIDPSGRSYEECLPEAAGAQVVVEVQQYMNQTSGEIGNQVGKVVGAGA